jgi:hypothetical protein
MKIEELEGELIPSGVLITDADLIAETVMICKKAHELTADNTTKEILVETMKEVSAGRKTLDQKRKEAKAPVLAAGKAVDEFYNRGIEVAKKEEARLKSAFSLMQRREEEARRKEAAAEAARIEKLAEKRAERAEKKGDEDRAEEIRREAEVEAAHAEAAIATQETEKPKGVSKREEWKIEVVDMKAFVEACLSDTEQRVSIDMLLVNQPAVNKLAKGLGKGCSGIPGVKAHYEEIVSVRS